MKTRTKQQPFLMRAATTALALAQATRMATAALVIILLTATTAWATDKTLSGSESYTANDGDVLTGSTSGTVTIANNATITLSDVTITGGIVCNSSATITLVGTNSVSNTWYSSAGIQIGGSGTTLTIKGNGSLIATGGNQSAGIGLGRTWDANATGGSVVIEGGTVTASGGNGIGTGTVGNSMTAHMDGIIIKGGTVNARLGKGTINYGSSVTIGTLKIYDGIEKVDASAITESVTYMHVDGNTETDVTASASTYFTIIEDGDRRIIEKKDNTDYTITIADNSENGTIACAAATAKYGEKITITATPDFGYRLSRLVVKDAQNNDVASTGNSFFMPKSNVTVSAVFEQGTHGTTEFAWGYIEPDGFVTEATIYDGVTTVELQQGKSYRIYKYDNEYSYRKFHLDNDVYAASIPYTGGTGEFYKSGNATNFSVPYDGETGYYDITMTDVGNGKWSVSILKTVAVMDAVPDQTYSGSAITPEPLVIAGSLSLTKGTDYVYSYENNTNVGTATVRVTFQGDYASLGYVEKEFNIVYPTVTTSYVDADGTLHENVPAIPLDNTMTTLAAGTYVVNDDVTIADRITVSGTVNLILGNNATLTASKGITVGSDATLNIYAQTDDEATMGALVASGANDNQQYNAGIGGVDDTAAGTITINGGKINATGMVGAGIGSGGEAGATVGTITINGGIVTAQDGSGYGAGIGGGSWGGKASTINLNGGIIHAAGIGSGYLGGDCSITVNISDGVKKIVATPVQGGACIGSGKSASGSVTVNFLSGGNVVTGDAKDAVFYDTGEGAQRQVRAKALNHTVSMSDDLKAHITVSTELAITGETVTLTLGTAVDASTLKVNDGTSDLTLTDAGNRNYTFTMPDGDVTVTATLLQTYAVSLPTGMEMVSATNAADADGKYITGTTVTFKASFPYAASDVSDGSSTLEPDANGIYTVTVADADITVTATVERSATIDLTDAPGDFTAIEGDVLTGSTSGTLTIADGAGITLSGATITGGIVCSGSATITLVGTNSTTGGYGKAGIQIGGSGTTLTINGDGTLTANGGTDAAGIGLNCAWNVTEDVVGGNIVINGGNITANGGGGGAGIGAGVTKDKNNSSSRKAIVGNITITGGTVTAVGGSNADGIGAGENNYDATIQIGTVTIYDAIEMVDASSIKDFANVVYMHGETNVTASKTDYFTIGENGDRRIIVPKDDSDYTITIADGIEHGTLSVAAATAKYMQTVTVTATPAFGYRFVRLIVKDAQNNDVASTDNSFFMPKSNVTVSAVFEQGTHGTTEFAWGYIGDFYNPFTLEATIYDGVTTVELQQGKKYFIGKDYYEIEPGMGYCENTFCLDEDPYAEGRDIPYSGGTGSFMEGGYGNFRLNGDAGFYDITMTDVGNGKWNVSILKTAGQMDVVPDQTYTGSEIKPEPLVMAGSLNLTKGTDYVYSYTNNTNVGTAKVRATFQGNYASLGYVEKTFTIAPRTYTVSFDANGGTGTMEPMQLTYNGDWVTLTANTFTRTGYSFKGWNTEADGTGTDYSDEELVRNLTDEANGNVVLYAQWGKDIATCEIRGTLEAYDDGYGPYNQLAANVEVWDGDTQLTPDTDYSIELDPDVDIYSYEVGKQYQATVTGMGDWGGTKTFTFTFVALHHTVVFVANGGSGTMAGGTVANNGGYAGRYTLPVCGFTAPDGKVFDHWVVDYAGIEENPIKQPGDYFTAPYIFNVSDVQTITVTAYWRDALILFDDDSNQPVGSKNADIIAANNGTTDLTVQLQGRTLYKDGAWNTLCLPFDLELSGSVLDGDDVDVRTLAGSDFSSGTLTLDFTDKDAVTTLEAGKPYIIRWDKPDNYVAYDGTNAAECSDLVNPVFNGVTVSTATANVETDCVDFIGILSPTVIYEDGAEKTNLYMGADNKLYYPTVEGFKLNACRGYFKLKGVVVNGNGNDNGNGNGVRSFDINFGEETTGVALMDNGKLIIDNEAGAWYDLSGRKLSVSSDSSAPPVLPKGVYIHNGRKVVVQ